MTHDINETLRQPLIDLLLSAADDKLFLGHANADWTGLAPILEEDIAFSSLAQDDLAHALAWYELVGELSGRSADAVAYGRPAQEYRCARLVTVPDEFDWALALVRQFFCDHFEQIRLGRLVQSAFEPVRTRAARMFAEEALSIGHADQWIIRLARGTSESRERLQTALDRLAPLAPELFEPTPGVALLEQAGYYPRARQADFDLWREAVENVLAAATVSAPFAPLPPNFVGGRNGLHTPEFAAQLDELTEVYRVEPEAAW